MPASHGGTAGILITLSDLEFSMTAAASSTFCPYVGLQPYTESDREYFFGRTRDTGIIISNLTTAPLTTLYGASGVGKSSVLLAGVIPELRQTPRSVVIHFRAWQDRGFVKALKQEVLREATKNAGRVIEVDTTLPFDDFLLQCQQSTRSEMFIILDQFEEYSLYHPPSQATNSFDAELARAINRRDVDAHFLFSLREDSLSKLGRFQGRISNLFHNILPLEHLDRRSAEEAIRKPLDEHNSRLGATETPISIEEPLVNQLLRQVSTQNLILDRRDEKVGDIDREDLPEPMIETAFLQMVLMRIWHEEMSANSTTLRLSTLERLGNARYIVGTHLDGILNALSTKERHIASQLFSLLVTPSGNKIAHTLEDLVDYTKLPLNQVENVLAKLSAPNLRVLRVVAPPDQVSAPRYEIFHDVLASAILDWRTRNASTQARREANRLRGWVAALAVMFMISMSTAVFAFSQRRLALQRSGEVTSALEKVVAAKNEAEKSAHEAQRQAGIAKEQQWISEVERVRADKQRDIARLEQQRAERATQLAESRRLEADALRAIAIRRAGAEQLFREAAVLQRIGYETPEEDQKHLEAIAKLQQAVNQYKQLNDLSAVAIAQWSIGGLYDQLGDRNEDALASYIVARETYRKLNIPSVVDGLSNEMARMYGRLGSEQIEKNNKQGAIEFLDRAAYIHRELGRLDFEVDTYKRVAGELLTRFKDKELAFRYYDKAFEIYLRAGTDHNQMQSGLNDVAEQILNRVEDKSIAIPFFLKIAEVYRKNGLRHDYANALRRVAVIYDGLRDKGNAAKFNQQADAVLNPPEPAPPKPR